MHHQSQNSGCWGTGRLATACSCTMQEEKVDSHPRHLLVYSTHYWFAQSCRHCSRTAASSPKQPVRCQNYIWLQSSSIWFGLLRHTGDLDTATQQGNPKPCHSWGIRNGGKGVLHTIFSSKLLLRLPVAESQ